MTDAEHNRIEKIEVDQLHFDPENPRLPVSMRKTSNEGDIIDWMLTDASLIELLESIAQQGYFDGEPLLGTRDGSKTIIVEGNRRLAAVKLFNNPNLGSKRKKAVQTVIEEAQVSPPAVLPVIVYTTRTEVLRYLGYRHITGIKSWGALAKARYLEQLQRSLTGMDIDQQFRQLAKEIGSNANYVGRLLTTLKVYEQIDENDFFGIPNLDEKTIDFSLLTTALSYSNVTEFVGLNSPKDITLQGLSQESLKELAEWIYRKNDANNTRLGESRNLKTLSAVVGNSKALTIFREGKSLKESSLYTSQPDEIFFSSLDAAKTSLETALQQAPHVSKANPQDIEKIIETVDILKVIHTTLKSKLKKDDNDIFNLG